MDSFANLAASAPLPPHLKAIAIGMTPEGQQGFRKGSNMIFATVLTFGAVVATIVAFILLVRAGSPRSEDGSWYGGWYTIAFAAAPLWLMSLFMMWRTSECEGDVVGTAAQFLPV